MEDEKLSGRVIIDTVLANMHQQVEELRYSKVVPAAYDVYLHADDQQRFESLAHEIAAEAVRALQERLDALNRPSRLDRVREMVHKPRLPFKKVGPWLVRITRDPEGAVPRGRALVVSQIALGGAESFEGQRTRRLATLSGPARASGESPHVASDLASRIEPPGRPVVSANPDPGGPGSRPAAGPPASGPRPSDQRPAGEPLSPAALAEAREAELADTQEMPGMDALAVLAWQDDAGAHRFRMTTHEMTVGRAVQGSAADVRLATLPDVSRVHLRVRYHPEDRRFSIEDLSLLGTTVNGAPLERGSVEDLPSPAEIRLADAITLRFESGTLS
jgi:FHA domain